MPDIRAVSGKREFAAFLDVPGRLYRDDPHYIEQLRLERQEHLGTKNPFFEHASHQYFIAWRNNEPVGRISAQLDRLAQREGAPVTGHFGLIEAVDAETLQALLAAAEGWLREKGASQVEGPFSLSINDESGLLIEGFDSPPRLLMNYAPPWYAAAIEAAGYSKAKDLLAYRLDCSQPLPRFAAQMAERAVALPGLVERAMDIKKANEEMQRVIDIFNDAWSDNWRFVPMTEAEGRYMIKNLKPVLVSKLVRVVEIGGEAAGMAVCLPDVNEALKGLGGRLLPFGWARLLWRLKAKRLRGGRVVLMGVRKRYRDGLEGAAIAVLLIATLYKACHEEGLDDLELSWILEDNVPVIRAIELTGGQIYKRYRIYQKTL